MLSFTEFMDRFAGYVVSVICISMIAMLRLSPVVPPQVPVPMEQALHYRMLVELWLAAAAILLPTINYLATRPAKKTP